MMLFHMQLAVPDFAPCPAQPSKLHSVCDQTPLSSGSPSTLDAAEGRRHPFAGWLRKQLLNQLIIT